MIFNFIRSWIPKILEPTFAENIVCKPSESDELNLPPHTSYLKNPSNTLFKIEQIDNATVVHYRNKLKSSHIVRTSKPNFKLLKIY